MGARNTPSAVVPDDDREDIRIAVVMNGGVSLAVWMGGVTNEINRLALSSPDARGTRKARGARTAREEREAAGEVYRGLLELVGATARVDVITGTSAGGINGAALAYAQVYRADLRPLGRVWADTGSLVRLLRSPASPHRPSLLRGDGHLLPELAGAFDRLVPAHRRPDRYVPPRDRPIDLMITGTLMNGEHVPFHDDFGSPVTEIDSAGMFRFARDAGTRPEEDPFHFSHDVVHRLALAARCTSSFPVAFEPGFAPVGDRGPDGLHPDLGAAGARPAVASFAPSRYVLDGGVLLNRPVEPALAAIYRQPAERQVRRLLMYVNPAPAPAGPEEPARHDAPPVLGDVLEALFRLPFEQSVAEELRRIEESNARVRGRRAERPALLGVLDCALAARLMPEYARAQTRREATRIHAAAVRAGERAAGWRRDDFEAALAACAGAHDVVRQVPAGLPGDDPATADWDWGFEAIEQVGEIAVDVLKRAIWLAPLSDRELRRRLRERRRELHDALADLAEARREEEGAWAGRARSLPSPPPDPRHRRRVLYGWLAGATARTTSEGRPSAAAEAAARRGGIALRIAAVLTGARDDLWRAAGGVGGEGPARRPGTSRATVPAAACEAGRLRDLLAELVPGEGTASPAAALRRMLAVGVCRLAVAGEPPEVEQEVVLQQISARTPNPFGGGDEGPGKLAGTKLGQFGAFYKKSWRVNDWIWGRLDGATRMVQAVLDPARLLQLGLSPQEAYRGLRAVAVGGRFADELAARFDGDRERIERELAFLDAGREADGPGPVEPGGPLPVESDGSGPVEPGGPLPVGPGGPGPGPELTVTVLAVARRLHAEILAEELDGLAEAVREDSAAGARQGPGARRFLEAWEGRPEPPPMEFLLEAFTQAKIGAERFADEVGTPLFLHTAGRAGAVGAAVIVSALGSALRPARLVELPWSVAGAVGQEIAARVRTGRREAGGLLRRLLEHGQ
ncbi:patatin-like protein [Planomonospora sp. ID91781]|uniref:patatin-like protein n=1 Tax=Planomonospora sp. ID91781 TaxID=2738135 RepID=UPI0018C40BD1|nr:patatin-like protein [Planomonospora sp. ID91781]MBG0824268.1 patatin-like protein [Planomonospora sp. ID91781]